MDSFFENMQRRKVDMNSKPIITFKNVSKTYTLYKNDRARFKSLFIKPRNPVTHKALDNISFEIRRGEAVGIMGDNGGGKSTLLKHVTGVTFPDEGEIEVNGMVAALLELTAGFVLEMTGRENIRLKGYILGLNDDEIDEIEQNVVDFAELGVYIDQPVRTYSSGMKMRLGFAINVNISPDILVIDEALAVGDASFKAKCKAKIRQIIETGVTVLYVSHNATSVEEICERSIFLKKGKLMFDGPTREAHLIYLIDKRKSQIDKRKEKIAELNKVIESATDDMLLTTERESLEKHYEKIEEFKDAGGLKITVDKEGVRYEAYEPLTIDDIDDLDFMELEELSKGDLEDLLSKADKEDGFFRVHGQDRAHYGRVKAARLLPCLRASHQQ